MPSCNARFQLLTASGQARLQSRGLRGIGVFRSIGVAAVLLLIGTDGLQNAVANGDTRTLSLYHLHTRDSLTVTFKRDGRFVQEGLSQLNHFLRDWRNDEETKMDPRLFDIVWQMYQESGATQPIQIISAYRSPTTNAMLRRRSRGVAQTSQHMVGKALDFNIPGVPLERVRNAGLRLQRGGVGFYPSSGSPFVHVDVGNVRHWPRLSPDALARVFPDGRTVHIPSNGRPMPGYALALADVARRNASPTDQTRPAPTRTAALNRGQGEQNNWLSRMFSGNGAGPDSADPARPAAGNARGAPQQIAPASPVAAPVQVADAMPEITAVPMPRSRPAPPPAQVAATEAATAQVTAVARFNSPADIINSRGFWGGPEMEQWETGTVTAEPLPPIAVASAAPVAPPAAVAEGPRMVWRVGPQPAARAASTPTVTAPTVTASVATPRTPSPRPRPEPRAGATVATVAAATTAGMTASVPWPVGGQDTAQAEQVPGALAYAAATPDMPAAPARSASPVSASPMGALRNAPAPRTARRAPQTEEQRPAAETPAPAALPAITGHYRLSGNPWLRAVVLAPSLYSGMKVSLLGEPDYLALAPLMHKPAHAVPNRFAANPGFGLAMRSFSGSAIAQVPVVRFRTVRLGMNN